MKRNMKIVLGVIILFAMLVITYIILIVKGILPNPFLDTSDLVCSRQFNYGNEIEEEKEIIKFDKFQRVTETVYVLSRVFQTLDDATHIYNKVRDKDYYKLNEENNSIESTNVTKISEKNLLYKKNKAEAKDYYLNELYYEICE